MQCGIIAQKKEMTKIRVDEKHVPVTILRVPDQELVRFKNLEKDGYFAAVIGLGKKEIKTPAGKTKTKFQKQIEFRVSEDELGSHQPGDVVSLDWFQDRDSVELRTQAKGKGFQGVMKRFHAKGGPKTHGSKFHRQIGSLGNRKPRRVQRGHPHAGRMGNQLVTLKNIPVLFAGYGDDEKILVVKGSVPGSYNSFVRIQKK